MRKLLHCLTWILALITMFLWVPVANAHPLGNFTINHYAGLQVAQSEIEINYVLDMAEIPAFQEINHLDTNHNRRAEPTETANYPAEKCDEVNSYLELHLNQQPLVLSTKKSAVKFPPGVGGLSTLRLTCTFQGAIPSLGTKNQLIEFADNSYPRRLGWREITVATHGIPIQGDFTSYSITKRLTDYPNALLSSPLNQRQVSFELNPFSGASQQAVPLPIRAFNYQDNPLTGRINNVFTSLIAREEYNPFTILIALAIAFLWGGLHALSPGHGKTVVGAYLVGSRSNAQHALFLGLTVTITHTSGIFALGLLTLSASQFILTEQLFPWLSMLSGVTIMGIGLNLLIERLRGTQFFQFWGFGQPQAEHFHNHEHSHAHSHNHSHLPLSENGRSMGWSSVLALGISGGLLPCPSALVVLLGAIALGRIGFGLALVSAFSLGLAAVLTGIGLILVYARGLFEQLSIQPPQLRMLSTVSALFITLVGLGITTQTWFVYTGR
jgi:ABC-type nickel/cobalt efflux system permease component RcnA